MKKIEIEIPDGKQAKWVNNVLTLVDEDVTERIKTFEDACTELGENHQYVRAYREWMRISYAECEDITAYMKLRIITAALNEGWKPKFGGSEIRYYPSFLRDSKGHIHFHMIDSVGLSISRYSVQLVFKSQHLAEYAAEQFIDIYKDFCYGRNKL